MRLQAHLVSLPDAAAKGSTGLLRPLLRKHYEGGMPATIFALPAVQVGLGTRPRGRGPGWER